MEVFVFVYPCTGGNNEGYFAGAASSAEASYHAVVRN